mgnify:CR=1
MTFENVVRSLVFDLARLTTM